MDARSFLIAVGPAIGAEVVVNVGLQLLSPTEDLSALRDVPVSELLALVVSFLVFPMWAGARVARATTMRWWFALGGVSVLLGTLVGSVSSALLDPSPIDASWLYVFVPILVASPFYAFLGFMGGTFRRMWAGHRARRRTETIA